MGFYGCYSTWVGKCTGTVRGGGGGKDQITVTDRGSKIAHVMVLRQNKAAKCKEQLLLRQVFMKTR